MFDQKAYARDHYLRNREKYLERAREQYAKNPEICIKRAAARLATPEGKAKRRKWRDSKPIGAFSSSTEKWRKENPEAARMAARIYINRRRARLENAPGHFSRFEWLSKIAYHGWKCLYCSKILTDKTVTMEHRKPLAKGGSNWLANLAPACRSCNSSRGAEARE